jgi:DNA-binding MarR family transcriptional regulator
MNHDAIEIFLTEWRRERPDLDPSPTGVVGRISRLAGHFRRSVDSYLDEYGLTWETFDLIATLRRIGAPYEMSPTELYKSSLLSASAVTNRIDRVAAMGLIVRTADPADRRSVKVKLSKQGKKLIDVVIARHFTEEAALLEALSSQEQDQLARLLGKLVLSAEQRDG